MKILNQTTTANMTTALSTAVVANEMSNIAMTLQTPTIMATYYPIDADLTETEKGFRNVTDYIGPNSTVLYNKIENMPMYGADNLLAYSQYNDEIAGYEDDLQSSAVIYPRTIFPKPGDLFTLNDAVRAGLFVVTNFRALTVRSNPFIEIEFRLLTRDPKIIDQLEKQINKEYTVSLETIGDASSLVLEKGSMGDLMEHVESYAELCSLYATLFYSREMAAFVFDGLPGGPGTRNHRRVYVDMTLWRFMFDLGIVIYDELLNYAASNTQMRLEKIYTSSPDVYVDEFNFKRSIIWQLYERSHGPVIQSAAFDEYRYPRIYEPSPNITKYQGLNIWYLENYDRFPDADDRRKDFYLWDEEFICRIRQNNLYDEVPITHGICMECDARCHGAPVRCYNPYLRNAVINYVNGQEIDWKNLQVSAERTVENYYLIPLILAYYKKYIRELQG